MHREKKMMYQLIQDLPYYHAEANSVINTEYLDPDQAWCLVWYEVCQKTSKADGLKGASKLWIHIPFAAKSENLSLGFVME